MIPVCRLHVDDEATITMLAEWRRRNMSVHPTQFRVSLEGTADWLRSKVLGEEGRILFLVCGPDGDPVGHYGLIDAVNEDCEAYVSSGMRGVPSRHPGIIGRARATAVRWATEELGARRILAVVFADNPIPLRRLRGAGFRQLRVLPLRRHEIGERIEYRSIEAGDPDPPDRYHVLMAFEPPPPKIPR